VFLIIVAQLYLDANCRPDLRASAQNLLTFVSLGIGLPAGTLLAGLMREAFKDNAAMLFVAPAFASIALLVLFWTTIPALGKSREPA
jgi:hypothetical protein